MGEMRRKLPLSPRVSMNQAAMSRTSFERMSPLLGS